MDEKVQVYAVVGTEAGSFVGPKGPIEAVGIMFPMEMERDGGPGLSDDEEVETKWLTLPAAKSLLIDLRDAIEDYEKRQAKGKG